MAGRRTLTVGRTGRGRPTYPTHGEALLTRDARRAAGFGLAHRASLIGNLDVVEWVGRPGHMPTVQGVGFEAGSNQYPRRRFGFGFARPAPYLIADLCSVWHIRWRARTLAAHTLAGTYIGGHIGGYIHTLAGTYAGGHMYCGHMHWRAHIFTLAGAYIGGHIHWRVHAWALYIVFLHWRAHGIGALGGGEGKRRASCILGPGKH